MSTTLQNVAETVVTTANALDASAPITQVANAALATAVNPNPTNILADIELAISLAKQLKTLSASHPTLASIVKALF